MRWRRVVRGGAMLVVAAEPDTISCPTFQFCLAAGNESIERFDR